MLNLVSVLIGLVTLAFGLVAFVPLLGWMNWLVIPIGIVGAAVGALSSSNGGRNLVFSPPSRPSTHILLRSFTSKTKNHLVMSRWLTSLEGAPSA